MEYPYIFNITIDHDKYRSDDEMIGDDGSVIDRVLFGETIFMKNGNSLYTYDVESQKEIFEKLKFGRIRIVGLDDYMIAESATVYRIKKDDTCC